LTDIDPYESLQDNTRVIDRLEAFIMTERDRYPTRESNIFAIALSDVLAYRQFLGLIQARLLAASAAYANASIAFSDSVRGHSGEMTAVQMQLMGRLPVLGVALRLEIESFYLFAKILLDEAARFLEYYFGQVRGTPMDSHDDLVKGWAEFCRQHGIDAAPELDVGAGSLKKDIADFRDYQIAHHKNPRTLRHFTFDAIGVTRMGLSPIYPTENDRQVESKATHDLLTAVDSHLEHVLSLIQANRQKSRLLRAPAARFQPLR
jgi:hypothetical protein